MCALTPPPWCPACPPHLLAAAQSHSTQVTKALSTHQKLDAYPQCIRWAGPWQQTQCWPDTATGLERGSPCTDTSSPYNTHTFGGLPSPKDGAQATWQEEDIRMGLEKAVRLPWAATGEGLIFLLALPSICW